MANNEVKMLTVDIGNYTGSAVRPLWYLPDGYGGITVLGAHLVGDGAGTSITGQLITLADAGTPTVNGTIGAFSGTVVYVESARSAVTVSTAWVDDGRWIGFSQASGTAPTHTWLNVYYVDGR